MRYSEDIPHDQLSKYASGDMLIFTTFIGIALLYVGINTLARPLAA